MTLGAPAVTERSITRDRLARIRLAIRNRRVSFPSQVPVFPRQYRPDVQWRVVALYFVQGWSCEQLAHRYGVTAGRIRQTIHKWVERATELGYLQRIPFQAFATPSTMHEGSLTSPVLALQPVTLPNSKTIRVRTQDIVD